MGAGGGLTVQVAAIDPDGSMGRLKVIRVGRGGGGLKMEGEWGLAVQVAAIGPQ